MVTGPSAHATENEVLIRGADFHQQPEEYRGQVRDWLRANGIDPRNTALDDIELHLLDAPTIAYTACVLDAEGRKQVDRVRDEVITRRVHSLLRVPFPDHLRRPW